MVRIDTIDVLDSPRWDELVAGVDGRLFLSRSWMSCLAETFDLHFEAVVESSDGRLDGGIPFVHIRDMRGERIVVLPFSDLAPPPVRDADQWKRLVHRVMEREVPIIVGAPADAVIATDDRFKVETAAVRQVLTLDTDLDELLRRMATQPRRHIRRAEREGIVFRPAETRCDLRAFYDLHLRVRKYRHGLLCQPFRLFESLWDRFLSVDDGCLLLGYDGNRVAGGCLLLGAGDTLSYKFAASHADYRSVGVSHGAVAAAIALAIDRGYAQLDLGRSDLEQPGLVDFKRRFGAETTPLSRFTWAPDSYRPPDVGSAQIITSLSSLLASSDVSDPVTEQAGNLLYRVFA